MEWLRNLQTNLILSLSQGKSRCQGKEIFSCMCEEVSMNLGKGFRTRELFGVLCPDHGISCHLCGLILIWFSAYGNYFIKSLEYLRPP